MRPARGRGPRQQQLIQNNVEICSSVTSTRWIVAEESPKSRKRPRTPVKAVTIPTSPKSLGSSNRANTIKDPIRSAKFVACEQTLAKPPRIARVFKSFIGGSCFHRTDQPLARTLEGELGAGLGQFQITKLSCGHRRPRRSHLGHCIPSLAIASGTRMSPVQTNAWSVATGRVHDVADFSFVDMRFERHEKIGLSHVAIIFGISYSRIK